MMLWSAPAGLALAALFWLALHGLVLEPIVAKQEAALVASRPMQNDPVASPDLAPEIGRIVASPIFALTTGPGAVTEPQIQLQGVAITPKSRAALLVVDGKPANWYELGATRDGITVMEIGPSKVNVDTVTGFKQVGLSDKPAVPPPNGGSPVRPGGDVVPSGFRSPQPPASAPSELR
jgi:hypothetical protein